MLFRTAIVTCVFALVLSSNAQSPGNTARQTRCPAGAVCTNFNPADRYPTLSTRPQSGTWQIQDFKPVDASITCSVVKYDMNDLMPVLHLLCPGPQVFAPLRVHLTLTWKNVSEVPEELKSMLVDRASNSLVKFKSKPGDSQVELTLHDAADTQSQKEWVKFTKVQVGLVVPPDR